MKTVFRKVRLPREIPALVEFDRRVFGPFDCFESAHWRFYESHWMLIDGEKAGCCAFEKHVDFSDDDSSPALVNSLYVASTGILPEFQGRGLGTLLKAWEIAYARSHGFTRIVT